jgi:hypothetical protein
LGNWVSNLPRFPDFQILGFGKTIKGNMNTQPLILETEITCLLIHIDGDTDLA